MFPTIVSRDLLASVRHELAKSIGEVGNARLAEAVAAGYGFTTNAALLTSIDNAGWSSDPVHEFNVRPFEERLSAAGASWDGELAGIVDRSLRTAGALVRSDRDATSTIPLMAALIWADAGWENLSSSQYLALGTLLLRRRMVILDADVQGLAGSLESAAPEDFVDRIRAAWRLKRNIDRPIADFLVSWATGQLHGIGIEMIAAYRPRIIRFFNCLSLTWQDDQAIPAPLESDPPRPRQPVRLTNSSQIRAGEFGLMSGSEPLSDNLAGVVAMAGWYSGESIQDLHRFPGTILGTADVVAAIACIFPGTDAAAIETLTGAAGNRVTIGDDDRYVVVRSSTEVPSIRPVLLGMGGNIEWVVEVPGPDATANDLSGFKARLRESTRWDIDWLVVDFDEEEAHPDAVAEIGRVTFGTGVALIAIKPAELTGFALEEALMQYTSSVAEPHY